jgi:hypothetical protein
VRFVTAPVDWTKHGWGIRVANAHELFRLISHIALLEQSRIYAWRGQRDATWQFDSSLYRKLEQRDGMVTESRLREAEQSILEAARDWGLGRDLGNSATDMHMLAVLQHHGVPTRLFDVTANPMTALYFAIQHDRPDESGVAKRADGALFAIDVTDTEWYETFQHRGARTYEEVERPLTAPWERALATSEDDKSFFRAFPALPDERMKAQEGFFLGSAVPTDHVAEGVRGLNPTSKLAPGGARLRKLLELDKPGRGRPARVPFIAIVIPREVKEKVRNPLKRTYNRRPRVMFPDVDGFREALAADQLD